LVSHWRGLSQAGARRGSILGFPLPARHTLAPRPAAHRVLLRGPKLAAAARERVAGLTVGKPPFSFLFIYFIYYYFYWLSQQRPEIHTWQRV
jgi:hypothetical protein